MSQPGADNSKTIAITGATGFIGKYLINNLFRSGDYQIRNLVHNDRSCQNSYKKVVSIEGDLLNIDTLNGFATPGCTVINLVYLRNKSENENLSAVDNLGKACASAGIKRLIHCSTAVVAGRVKEKIIDENTLCRPGTNYERTKLLVENMLVERYKKYFEIIILRPTAILGPGGQNLVKMANELMMGSRLLNYARSCLFNKRKMNLVAIENVVAAIKFLISYEDDNGDNIFIISDDEDDLNEYRRIESAMMSCFGHRDYPMPVIPMPLMILRLALKYARKTNYNPRSIYSCRKIVNSGFRKETSLGESLIKFAKWHKNHFEMSDNSLKLLPSDES